MLGAEFFFLSIAVWIAAAALSVCIGIRKKSRNFSNGIGLFSIGTFLSLLMLHMPLNNDTFGNNPAKTLLVSTYNALQVFFLDGSFERYESMPVAAAGWPQAAFPVWTAILYMLAPLLTFGFVLLIFKNLLAYLGFLFGHAKDTYVFSALNERSLILAESIREKHPKALLVFANPQKGGDPGDFAGRCAAINTLQFKKNIRDAQFQQHSKNTALYFFLIDEDETINEQDASALIPSCAGKTNVRVYLFSERVESDMLLQSLYDGRGDVKLFRIDETQSLVFNYLYEHSIFNSAVTVNDEKIISLVIIGLDKLGAELLKALSWCGQMKGYKLIINAFDESPHAESRLRASCPELMARRGIQEKGEAYYEIIIHNGIDYGSSEFLETLRGISPVTYIFVTTGNDEQNIDIAMKVHLVLERNKCLPPICARLHNPHKAALLEKHSLSYKNQQFNISVFGDLKSCYSGKRIMYSELEQQALERHKKWGGSEIDFYSSEYHYRSSLAWVIRKNWRDACGIDHAERAELEHKGWNAYMRSIGYSYSGSTDKTTRNDRARLHHDLVAFDLLSEEDKRKDEADL
jgi:hypothetical protein